MSASDERQELCAEIGRLLNSAGDWLHQRNYPDSPPIYSDGDWQKHLTMQVAAISRIREVIKLNVDRWISVILGTLPGRWTTDLLDTLRKMQMTLSATNPAEKQIDRSADLTILEECLGDLYQRNLRLRDLDLSGWVDPEDEQAILSKRGMVLAYVVRPKVPDGTTHRVPNGTFANMVVIRQPSSGGQEAVVLNTGDFVPANFTSVSNIPEHPSPEQVYIWSDRFYQTVFTTSELIISLEVLVNTAGDLNKEKVNEILAKIGKLLHESCELGSLLISLGGRISSPVSEIENFLIEPILVKDTGGAAINCAKRIAVQFDARNRPIAIPTQTGLVVPDEPLLPAQCTLIDIRTAYPTLNESAIERIRKNLDHAVGNNKRLGSLVFDAGNEQVKAYDAELVRKKVAQEIKSPNNSFRDSPPNSP